MYYKSYWGLLTNNLQLLYTGIMNQLADVDIGQKFPFAQNFQSLGQLVSSFLPNILLLSSIIFFILVIIAGLGVVMSAGSSDPQTQEKARSFLTYAVIGLIIIFSSYWILQLINVLTFGSLKGLVK